MSGERDCNDSEETDQREEHEKTGEGSDAAAESKRKHEREAGMTEKKTVKDIQLGMLQMESFLNDADESLHELLNLMLAKKAEKGCLSMKMNFELTEMLATDTETGEMVTLYKPSIDYDIKKKVSIETTSLKGNQNRGLLRVEDGYWTECADTGQLTLFD